VLEGWLGYNARTKKVVVRNNAATQWAGATISYPKLIRTARMLGWSGQENAVTFV